MPTCNCLGGIECCMYRRAPRHVVYSDQPTFTTIAQRFVAAHFPRKAAPNHLHQGI